MRDFYFIARMYRNEENAMDYLREAGILPLVVICSDCQSECSLRQECGVWYCSRTKRDRGGKVKCSFTVSDFEGTFLDEASVPAWKILLFVSEWVDRTFEHTFIQENLKWNSATIEHWTNFCCDVVHHWYVNKSPIGCEKELIDIGEICLTQLKCDSGNVIENLWLLGGILRNSGKSFIAPLESQARDKATIMEIIRRNVATGSEIISLGGPAYSALGKEGYVNHPLVSPDPEAITHGRNMEAIWRDLKTWLKRQSNSNHSIEKNIARYLFHRNHRYNPCKYFLTSVSEMYKPAN